MQGYSSYKILVVEDDEDILNLLDYNLTSAGFKVLKARDGTQALQLAKKETPDLILLDIMLPEIDGIEVCKTLKKNETTQNIPLIMVTAKGEEIDRVVGLEVGAEDYIVKPFSPRELILRIRALLKRVRGIEDKRFQQKTIGPISINTETHEVEVDKREIELTPTEFKLLWELVQRPSHVLTRDSLLDRVWGTGCYVTPRTVDTHIRRLREKLGKAGELIETVRGFGYRIIKAE